MVMYVFEQDWVAPGCSATPPRRLHAFMTYKIDDEQKTRQVEDGRWSRALLHDGQQHNKPFQMIPVSSLILFFLLFLIPRYLIFQ